MFRVAKAPYEMEVVVRGETIRVRPVKKYLSLVGRTLARCEEFLAQQFCLEQHAPDKNSLLQAYFRQRGWQICT